MFNAYVKMASGFCWLVGAFDTRTMAQFAIDNYMSILPAGVAIGSFIVPAN